MRQADLVALTHEAELEELKRQYNDEIGALMEQHMREQTELRQRSASALAHLIARFEKRRSASVARLQVRLQLLSTAGAAAMVVGKA